MPDEVTRTYSREEVRRVLGVSERQLRSWEKELLVPAGDRFRFEDLLTLRTLLRLQRSRVPARRIRQAVEAVRIKLRDIVDPLRELKVFTSGRRVVVQVSGQKLEAVSGQLLLDFDAEELNKLRTFPSRPDREEEAAARRRGEAEGWFEKGLALESGGAPVTEVMDAYRRAIELDPKATGALVNLGTLHFNARDWKNAEAYYRKAVEADSEYALAHFNLGNVLDENGDRAGALVHYQAALRLNPHYSDAHYNIALLYQHGGQTFNAVRHWKTYLKLDPSSSWSLIARRELENLQQSTVIPGNRTR